MFVTMNMGESQAMFLLVQCSERISDQWELMYPAIFLDFPAPLNKWYRKLTW